MKLAAIGAINRTCKSKKKQGAAEKGAAFLASVLLAGSFAVLPLNAEEEGIDSVPYTQEAETVSGNDEQPDPKGQNASNPPDEEHSQPDTSESDASGSSQQDNPNPVDSAQPVVPPRITSQPEDARVEAGDCAYFNVSAVGTNLIYQWYVSKGDGRDFQKIDGARESLYCVMVFDGAMNGYAYKCRVESKDEIDMESDGAGSKKGGKDSGENYVYSRAAKLTIFYRIVSGARSVWVRSSGRGLVFQGSGAYSKLDGVSVDGGRITAGEYNKGGSQTPFTEITLLRSYLETLSEGDHEIEIVWSDGSAKTSFRIEPPATNLSADASGLGRTGADTEGSSRAAGTTSAVRDAALAASGTIGSRDADKEGTAGQISGNALDGSLSENTMAASPGTAADILRSAGFSAALPEKEMTVTPGAKRTHSHPSDYEKKPVQLAGMSDTLNRYAGNICMAVILISAAGIVSGLLAYRLHDVEGHKR